jgi:hypothetical protein
MLPSHRRRLVAAAVFAFVCSELAEARAGEIQVAAGPGAYASSWRGDATAGQALKLGYRIADVIALDFLGRLGYGTVDERVLTYVSLGATGYARIGVVRPWLRLSVVHQHEEPTTAVKNDPWGAVFGVGDGIRHRGGLGSSLGFDVPVYKHKTAEFVLGIDTTATWFPDPRGPTFYYGGSLWAGLNYGL